MKDATDITMILDRSGSMGAIKKDTIGGVNQFIEDQRSVPGECCLTLIQFDSQDPQEVVRNAVPIASVEPLTDATFIPRANTPLYDAIGRAVVAAGERFAGLPESERPNKVVFVIATDGEENSSLEYTKQRVLDMIKTQSEVYKWTFVYLGANQDAMRVGASISIPTSNSMTYAPTPDAVRIAYIATSQNLMHARMGAGTGNLSSKAMAFTDEQRRKAAQKKGEA